MLGDPLTDDELKRRAAKHPAKEAAFDFIDAIFKASRPKPGALESRADRERDRAWKDLYVRFRIFCDLFDESVPSVVEEVMFTHLLKIMRATLDVGKLLPPDGRVGREVQRDNAQARKDMLVRTVKAYLDARPDLPLRVSRNFANIIEPDIAELMCVRKGMPGGLSTSAVVEALVEIRNRQKSGLTL